MTLFSGYILFWHGFYVLKISVQYSGAWHNLYQNGRNLLFGRRFSLRYGRFPSCFKTTNSDGVADAKHFHTPQFDAVLSDWVECQYKS